MIILKPQLKSRRENVLIVIVPCLFLGLVMLVSGSGKLPGQTEFIDALLGSFWTPTVANLIGHGLPWVEIILGALLLLGLFPRIAAVLSLPLLAGFMGNNVWAISQGKGFGQCGCFGVWESIFGAMTPFQALGLDITLLFLALIIILFHPAGFFNFRWWFTKRRGERSR
jgi:uncharacterized membrane protein YphA (DoxX/SURF4 family)